MDKNTEKWTHNGQCYIDFHSEIVD
jgi:hypothetical protein